MDLAAPQQQHQQPLTLNVVGCGRVGQTLGRLWHLQGHFRVQDVLTTSLAHAQAACQTVGGGHAVAALSAMRPAAVWMLAVPDTQIAGVAQQLAQQDVFVDSPPVLAFHCSGALAASELAPLAARGWQVGSAHCILSFASVATALAQFAGTVCAIEGDAPACGKLQAAFSAIGAQCFTVPSEDKLLYHAAAVFATNFVPVLQAVAQDLWRDTGMPEHLIGPLCNSVLRYAVENLSARGPQAALTGPAARGDLPAIARQGAAVQDWNAQAGAAYHALSALALRLAAQGHTRKL